MKQVKSEPEIRRRYGGQGEETKKFPGRGGGLKGGRNGFCLELIGPPGNTSKAPATAREQMITGGGSEEGRKKKEGGKKGRGEKKKRGGPTWGDPYGRGRVTSKTDSRRAHSSPDPSWTDGSPKKKKGEGEREGFKKIQGRASCPRNRRRKWR